MKELRSFNLRRAPWTKSKPTGQKPPLEPRTRQQMPSNVRELAMHRLAIEQVPCV